uniref:Leukocyte elastase inhibitor-like n=1 Tax=Pogona vitticeps TaxID=103695 RepID=A0ABM5GDC8_9SAUR
MATMSEANAKFAIDCFRRLAEEHPCDNLLFSPVNATSALGLLALASGCEQAADIEKVLHWDELKECDGPRKQRYLTIARSFGPSATRLKTQEKIVCPKQRAQPEPACPQQRPRPEPICPKPRPCPEPTPPEQRCPKPRPRPEPACPEPAQPPCPERNVPEYECETPQGVHTAFSKILAALHAPSTNYALSFANKLYGDHAIAFIQKFIYCALKLYWTDVAGADIHNAPEEVRRIINLWVEVQTHGKIRDLFPKDSFDCLAQLLQVNALYFKGQWDVKFDKELTVEAPFYSHHADARDCQTVLLMNRKGIYNTAMVDICGVEVRVLEVPYKDNEMSFFVLLPTDCSPEALQQLEDSLTHEHLLNWSCQLKPAEVDVFIPKFSLEKSLYAIECLDLPNLQDPEKADFSRATTTEKVALTQLAHDTFIEIDEEGGEEAQPQCCPKDRCPRREAVEVVADHPFLYFIQHNCTQSILALGRFAKPE